jgi:hypothetical protein
MLGNCKNGISSYEVARDLVTQKTASFVLRRIRLLMQSGWQDGKNTNERRTVLNGRAGGVENEPATVTLFVGDPACVHRLSL